MLEDGIVTVSDKGTGQGSVISPLLANLYLHYVFDLWAERWRRREAAGNVIIVRYADDIVVGFEHETDARALPGRDAEAVAGVCIVATCGQDPADRVWALRGGKPQRRGLGKPETFNFLGFSVLQQHRRRLRRTEKTVSRSCVIDEGRPLEIGFQEQVSNHSKLLR